MSLVKQFKEQSDEIFVKLISKKYTLKDAWNQQQLIEYIQAIVRQAKETDIKDIYN